MAAFAPADRRRRIRWKTARKTWPTPAISPSRSKYRLAPPGALPGQTSAGFFPDQTADVQLAIRTARSNPRGNGKVGAIGGSAGGHHAALAACIGSPGDDRVDVAISLSGAYGPHRFLAPNPGINAFTAIVTNFVNVPTTNTASFARRLPGLGWWTERFRRFFS